MAIDPAAGQNIYWAPSRPVATIRGAPARRTPRGRWSASTVGQGWRDQCSGRSTQPQGGSTDQLYWPAQERSGAPSAGGPAPSTPSTTGRAGVTVGVAIEPNPAAPERFRSVILRLRGRRWLEEADLFGRLFSRPHCPAGLLVQVWGSGDSRQKKESQGPRSAGRRLVEHLYCVPRRGRSCRSRLLRGPVGTGPAATNGVSSVEGRFGC